MSLTDAKLEFWGEMQKTLFVENSAVWMASTDLTSVISEDGRKAHKPIISKPKSGTYTPYSDINFEQKKATKQTLEVDTFSYAADEIDDTDTAQSIYPFTSHSAEAMMKIHNNRIEQEWADHIDDSKHKIEIGVVDTTNVFDLFEEAESKLGSYDAPFDTSVRGAVFGPHTIATMRKTKSQRESGLGDSVMSNGIVGPWNGWTVIQNNNLPYSAKLGMATQPTADDTVTIAGVEFKFVASLSTTPAVPGTVKVCKLSDIQFSMVLSSLKAIA